MISHLSGRIIYKDLKYAVMQTSGGVGYKVYATNDTLSKLGGSHNLSTSLGSGDVYNTTNNTSLSSPVDNLWIYTVVREDALDLYGFLDREHLDFFELLITISGIGPKSALGILNVATVDSIREAVLSGETSYLTKISGIGKKIAEKIVLELKGKVGAGDEYSKSSQNDDVDALEALKALGYTHKESKEALEKLDKNIVDVGEKVKASLKYLGK
jgi:Holliday junction DNA helicase RuvA